MSRILRLLLVTALLGVALLTAILMLFRQGMAAPQFRTTATATAFDASTVSPAVVTALQAGGYDVSMSPMGTVHFTNVPHRIVTQDANYNDMLYALRQEAGLIATGYSNNIYGGFYAQVPGATSVVDYATITFLSAGSGNLFDKELLYRLHADVHHIDPVQLASIRGWSKADVEEIARNVGPFFANRFSRENNYSGKDPYTYYTAFELAEKVGEVYRSAGRIRRLQIVYDRMVQTIVKRLPPIEQRPRVGLALLNNGKFTPYSLLNGGFGQAQYRAVGARDAFEKIAGSTYGSSGGAGVALDLEGLLAINPDIIIVPFSIYPTTPGGSTSRAAYERLLALRDDPIGSRLAALQNKRVYPGGSPLQGPVFLLFQVEMAAKQIYPDQFGAYRDDQCYPKTEQLFDRTEVAAAIRAND